ncbi:MAG: cytochrome c [Verrucomicrobiales bacterium]
MDSPEDQNIDYEQGSVSAADLHDSVRRELPLLPGEKGGVGVAVFVVSALILILGGAQLGPLFLNGPGFSSSIYMTRGYEPAPRPTLGDEDEVVADVAWIEEWMSEGQRVYGNCVACHQSSGLGMPGQFPPLLGSEWVDQGTKRLGAILLQGAHGPFTVAGQTYNQLMPGWGSLSDEKLAQVTTYIRREFGSLPEGEDGVVTTEMMEAAREEFGGRGTPWTEAELKEIPAEADLPGPEVDLETGEPVGDGEEAADDGGAGAAEPADDGEPDESGAEAAAEEEAADDGGAGAAEEDAAAEEE